MKNIIKRVLKEMEEEVETYSNKRRRINTYQKSKGQVLNEVILLELLDYIQKNERMDEIVLNAYCKGKNADIMILNLRKNLRSEEFKENYIKVPDIESIKERYKQCDIERLNEILNENDDEVIMKKKLEESKKEYNNISNEILTLTKQLAKRKIELETEEAAIDLIESIISFKFINGIKNVEILDNALSEKLK